MFIEEIFYSFESHWLKRDKVHLPTVHGPTHSKKGKIMKESFNHSMDKTEENVLHDPISICIRMFKNVRNLRANNKSPHEFYEKQESRTNSWFGFLV